MKKALNVQQLPDCLLNNCDEPAAGIVCINHNESGMTIVMAPACTKHGEKMKESPFTFTLQMDDNPTFEFVDEGKYIVSSDCTLSYMPISDD